MPEWNERATRLNIGISLDKGSLAIDRHLVAQQWVSASSVKSRWGNGVKRTFLHAKFDLPSRARRKCD